MTHRSALVPAQANPWSPALLDVEGLHAGATAAIVEAVSRLRELGARRDRECARPAPLVVLGTAGIGKTHLFARLRRTLGPRAVLVHVRPLVGSDLTPRFLLSQILAQLGYESHGVRQIEAMAGAVLAMASGNSHKYPRAHLAYLGALTVNDRESLLDAALESLLERDPDLDEAYVRRLLSLPFMKPLERTATLAWLGGHELDEPQAARIGVRAPLSDERVTRALRTLAVVAAPAAPLLLVFDQLENLVDGEGHRVRAYGNLIADLVDVVRDVVIVQMALDTEWVRAIEPAFSLSQRQRAAGKRLLLGLPSRAECEALLQLWISQIPDREAPYPWPFAEPELERLLRSSGTATPRMLLLWLGRTLEGEPLEDEPPSAADRTTSGSRNGQAMADREILTARLAAQWEEHVGEARRHIDQTAALDQGPEPALLVDGIVALASVLDGFRVLSQSSHVVRVDSPSDSLHLGLLCHPHPRSIASACQRFADISGSLLVMRERWRDFKPTWTATRAEWLGLLKRDRTRWHWLDREDAVRLLALEALLKDARSGDISGPDALPVPLERVRDWVRGELDPLGWPVTRALRGEEQEGLLETAVPSVAPRPVSLPTRPPGEVLEVLARLRVASLERVEREIARTDPTVTRARVVGELRGAGERVRWFGESIVCIEEIA